MLESECLHVALDRGSHVNFTEQLLDAMDALEAIRDDQSLPPGQRRHRPCIGQQRCCRSRDLGGIKVL